MHVVACRWEPFSLGVLLDEGASVSLVIDEWESINRRLDPELISRLYDLHVVASFDAMDAMAALATDLGERTRPDLVVSLCEYGQFGAAYLAHVLGLPEPGIALSVRTRDKRAMKLALRSAGVPCARFATLECRDGEGTLNRIAETFTFPVVVKPVAGMGTVDTFIVETEQALRSRAERIPRHGHLLVEEMIGGDEYHVDGVWVRGQPQLFGVSRYLVPRIRINSPGVDNGSALIPPSADPAIYEQAAGLQERVNRALGICDGITHMEMFRRPDGELVFSEIATRPAGGGITLTFRQWGADIRTVWIRSLIGRAAPPELRPSGGYVGWVNIGPSTPGRIVRVPSPEEVARFSYVRDVVRWRDVGDVLPTLHPSTWTMMLVFEARSWEQYVERAADLQSALALRTRAEP